MVEHPGSPVDHAATVDDCWKRIGVAGDGSCPKLSQHVRCLNCPVYAQASRMLLDRMHVTEIKEDRQETMGADTLDEANESATLQALVFRLQGEWLALPVSALEEVAAARPVHGVPHRRNGSLQGLVNVRGTLLPCVSLAAVLHVATVANVSRERPRMLVLGAKAGNIVVSVDEVDGIHPIAVAKLSRIPATLALSTVRHTVGWGVCGKRQVGLLDAGLVRVALERGMQ